MHMMDSAFSRFTLCVFFFMIFLFFRSQSRNVFRQPRLRTKCSDGSGSSSTSLPDGVPGGLRRYFSDVECATLLTDRRVHINPCITRVSSILLVCLCEPETDAPHPRRDFRNRVSRGDVRWNLRAQQHIKHIVHCTVKNVLRIPEKLRATCWPRLRGGVWVVELFGRYRMAVGCIKTGDRTARMAPSR